MKRRDFLAGLALSPWFASARAATTPAVFVVHPYDTPSRLYARFRPLTLYLGGVLGRPMRLVIATTYGEQIEMIASGRADFAYLGPTPYVRARVRAKVEILAGEAEDGQAFYQSALVVREDSPIQRVADLAGKRLALGAEISLGSSLAPKMILAQAGLKRGDLAAVVHLDRHERVALAVLHGDFDAGGLRLDIARAYAPRGLRILVTSPPLPPHVIAASPGVSAEEAGRVRLALLHPSAGGEEAARALGKGISFLPVEDAHYHAVRRMERTLGAW
ncbi:MAG: PhnD/SsuA/transferrin family substrate-binding protein [Pseudomonadota bacterium]|nr:PhnD/SsuA/transferrin family substrate-binding protein [Pseudomonadota bacterium]